MRNHSAYLEAVAALALALAGVRPVQAAPATAVERQAIEAVVRQYERALTAASVQSVMSLYSKEPVFMPEYAPAAVGRVAVRDAYAWVFSTLKLNGVFHVHEVDVNGEQAWARTSSTGRFTVLATGIEADVGNSEFFLFVREGGSWKIHRYMFTADKPLAR